MPLVAQRFALLALLALLAVFVPVARPASAASLQVTNTSDSGPGSLRQAILDANGAGADTITFTIPAGSTISVSSPLPAITDNQTTIQGPTATGGKPGVEIKGNPTTGPGLRIESSNNTIRNLIISGFIEGFPGDLLGGAGIAISGASRAANGNTISNCYIGTNPAGTGLGVGNQSSNNTTAGILITDGASSNTISNNVIAGNGGYGVYVYSAYTGTKIQDANTISNNSIGVAVDGTTRLRNTKDGVLISDNSINTIVGPDNTISGNGPDSGASTTYYNVQINGRLLTITGVITGNKVRGNKIGTNKAGNGSITNTVDGVFVSAAQDTIIGGAASPASANADRGNIISGNINGVLLRDRADIEQALINPTITNNWIGLNAAGSAALANNGWGVLLERAASSVVVGPGNVISGNAADGIYVLENNSTDANNQTRNNTFKGNLIGTNPAGTAALPNALAGIRLKGAVWNNRIQESNRLSGNSAAGVVLESNTNGSPYQNTIRDNQIGPKAGGGSLPNGPVGVLILSGNANTVGPGNSITGHSDIVSGAGIKLQGSSVTQNSIKGNTLNGNTRGIYLLESANTNTLSEANIISGSELGLLIEGTGTDSNLIQGNQVESNTNDGIYVSGGAQRNRITQTSTTNNGGATGLGINLNGGNLDLAAPSLSGVTVTGTKPTLTLSGSISSTANCTGGCTVEVFQNDVAENGEGKGFLTSFSSTGSGSFSQSITSCKPYLTFTITDGAGNTSEFSAATSEITGCNPPPINNPAPALSPKSQSLPGTPGQQLVFSHTLTNNGGPGQINLAVSGPNGWSVTVNPSSITLNQGQSTTVEVSVTVPVNIDAGSYSTTLTATAPTGGASDSATDTVVVALTAGLTLTPNTQTKQAGPGQQVCFDHTLTNTGNGSDSYTISVTPPNGWSQPQNQTMTVAKGASQIVTVCLVVPQGVSPTQYSATVTATSNSAPNPSVSVSDVVDVVAAAVPELSPAQTKSTDPGVAVNFTHTITNVGSTGGDFSLSLEGVPVGWTSAITPSSLNLGQGLSTTFTVVVTPTATALAGSSPFTIRATNQANTGIFDTVTDIVVVNQIAGIQLSEDQSSAEMPDTIVTYTLTLTNSGNFTDTISLTASASQIGWTAVVSPSSIAVPAGASVPVLVQVTVPAGQVAGVSNITTVTATSSAEAGDTALITTTIKPVPGIELLPPLITQSAVAGETLTYTFSLVNSGSLPIMSAAITVTGVPARWTATMTPTTVVGLGVGVTSTLELVVQTPPGIPNQTVDLTVQATATTTQGQVSDTAIARVRIGPPYGVLIEPDNNGSQLPGASIRYTHYVTNTGRLSDTFTLSTRSSLGWDSFVNPSSVRLAPNDSAAVVVTVQVPRFVDAGVVDITTVTARSTSDQRVSDKAIDQTTIQQIAGVTFSPSRSETLVPGRTIQFEHTIVNDGNGTDSFTISVSQDLKWSVTVVPTQTVRLPRSASYPIQVQVRVPANVPPATANRIVLQARSSYDTRVTDVVEDTLMPAPAAPPAPNFPLYLPFAQQATKP